VSDLIADLRGDLGGGLPAGCDDPLIEVEL
jgi:hypothetical protein